MAIFKIEKNDNYTVMSNYHLRDKNISLKAKGMLSFMLSLPEDWDYSLAGLVSVLKENETSIKAILSELKDNNYLKIIKKQNDKGLFEYVYNIYEYPYQENNEEIENTKKESPEADKPVVENPTVDNPVVDNPKVEVPEVENQGQINTNILNTKILNTNKQNNKKKKKEKTDTEFDTLIKQKIQNEDVKNAIYDFIKMRKAIKKPLTTKGLELNINKLNKLSTNTDEQLLIINNSIMNNWQGLFPLKEEQKKELKKEDDSEYREVSTTQMTEEEYQKKMQERSKKYV